MIYSASVSKAFGVQNFLILRRPNFCHELQNLEILRVFQNAYLLHQQIFQGFYNLNQQVNYQDLRFNVIDQDKLLAITYGTYFLVFPEEPLRIMLDKVEEAGFSKI